VIEKVGVIEYEDISLPGGADVNYFSFPTLNTGYAASDKLYKTTDGGKSWSNLNLSNIKGVEFVNESVGYCVSGTLVQKTADGGATWTICPAHAQFMGLSKSGIVFIVDYKNPSVATISVSTDQGATFYRVQDVSVYGNMTGIKVLGTMAFVTNSETYSGGEIDGIDMADTSKYVRLGAESTAYASVNDVYFEGATGAVVGKQGNISHETYGSGFRYLNFTRIYFDHTYEFNSIDGFDGLMVAVGNKTMASNLDLDNDEEWNELFNKDQNGFDKTFLKIRFFDKSTFFVGGTGGLFWKAKI
jgi:hypothetical protein